MPSGWGVQAALACAPCQHVASGSPKQDKREYGELPLSLPHPHWECHLSLPFIVLAGASHVARSAVQGRL